MKEDWLNKVHDRMTDYETDEPENLWDSLESRLADTSSGPLRVKRQMMKWIKRGVTVAATVAVFISTCVYLFNFKHDFQEPRLVAEASNADENFISGSACHPQKQAARNATHKMSAPNLIAQNKNAVNVPETEPSIPSAEKEIKEAKANSQSDENQNGQLVEEDKKDNSNIVTERNTHITKERSSLTADNDYVASIESKTSPSNKFTVSLYSSGGTGSALNYNSKGDAFSAIGPDYSDWEDKPLLGILVFNQGKEIKTEIKHRLPIKAGISFAYQFSGKFSMETGLSYTYLISDIKEGSDSHYYTGEQKLHYIGIPINLKYHVFSWKRLDFYASAGVLGEKCVSAKIRKEFIIDHKNKGSESENLSEKPMQWSVNASLGVQCNLINSMGLFVEPGVSYYFDDGTDIPTIYKEKPLNFNLNMGLRFTFGE